MKDAKYLITQLVDTFPNNAINVQIPPLPTIKYLKEKENKKLKGDICKTSEIKSTSIPSYLNRLDCLNHLEGTRWVDWANKYI